MISLTVAPVEAGACEVTLKYTVVVAAGAPTGGVTHASTGVCVPLVTATDVTAAPEQEAPAVTNFTVQPAGKPPEKLGV